MNLNATISISRTTSNQRDTYVHLRVTDDASRCVVIDVEMEVTAFAQAVMGLSEQKCLVNLNRGNHIGCLYEHKTELVWLPNVDWPYVSLGGQSKNYAAKEETAQALIDVAMASLEIDGWRAHRGSSADYRNGHRVTRRDGDRTEYRVGFFRFVDAVTKQPVTP